MPRLLADTAFGTSAFALCLHERFACCRPLRQVAEWMTGQGLAISAGTIVRAALAGHPWSPAGKGDAADGRDRLAVEEAGAIRGTSRARLWCAASRDAIRLRVDARRNAGRIGAESSSGPHPAMQGRTNGGTGGWCGSGGSSA